MNDLGIFVCACKKYEWIYPHFMNFAKKNLKMKFKFFAEDEPMSWRDRMLHCLANMKEYKDVIYLQEDFLIKYVDETALCAAYELHKKHRAYITKLGVNYEFAVNRFPAEVEQFQVYIQNPNDTYLMSHQPVSIYNKDFLVSTLTPDIMDASCHEILGSKIMRANKTTKVLCVGEVCYPNKSYIFEIEHAIRKGELIEEARILINENS